MLFYNLTKSQIKTIVKYAIFIGLVYLILKSVPSRNIQNSELVLILSVVCISFLIIDMILSGGFNEEFGTIPPPPLPPKIVTDKEHEELYNNNNVINVDDDDVIVSNRSKSEVIKQYPSQLIKNYSEEEIKQYINSINKQTKPISENSQQNLSMKNIPSAEIKKYLEYLNKEYPPEDTQRSPNKQSSKSLPEVSCSTEIIKVKKQMEQQMAQLKHELASRPIAQDDTSMTKRYYDSLLSQLKELNIINSDDVNNMNNKIATGVTTITEAISSLEKLKNFNTSRIVKGDYKYNELPEEFFKPLGEGLDKLNSWDNQYSILNTNKWRVPMPRPPICINTQPCKVCPDDTGLGSVDNSLKVDNWDSAKAISENKINKQWVASQ